MTENILTELYYGRIAPWAREPARGAAARELDLKIEKELQYFRQRLTPADYDRFSALDDLRMEACCLTEADAFCVGFRLGVKLVTASVADDCY